MSTLGVKFSDFALTGVFSVIALLLPYGFYAPDMLLLHIGSTTGFISDLLDKMNFHMRTVFCGLLTILALVICIVLGFFAHLIGELTIFSTNKIFVQHMKENSEWFSNFIRRHMRSDMRAVRIVRVFDGRKVTKPRKKRHWFLFWKRSNRHKVGFLRGWIIEHRALRQLETRMMCYIYAKAGNSIPADLTNQLRYFHIGRSIGVSLGLSFMLFALLLVLLLSIGALKEDEAEVIILIYMILFFLITLGMFFANRPYSRFCATLFSLVHEYVVKEGKEEPFRTKVN